MAVDTFPDWTEILPEISEQEAKELVIAFSSPAVQKYFRRVCIEQMIAQSKVAVLDIIEKPNAHIADAAFSKGRMGLAQEIIEYVIQHQRAAQAKLRLEDK